MTSLSTNEYEILGNYGTIQSNIKTISDNLVEVYLSKDVYKKFMNMIYIKNNKPKLSDSEFQSLQDSVFLNGIHYLCEVQTTSSTSSLLFEGKIPRKDVLVKLYKMKKLLKAEKSFPEFQSKGIEYVVHSILGDSDSRTYEKYIKCIKQYSEEKKNEYGFTRCYDVERFCDLVPYEI